MSTSVYAFACIPCCSALFCTALDIPADMRRFDVPEAALGFVAAHAGLFSRFILKGTQLLPTDPAEMEEDDDEDDDQEAVHALFRRLYLCLHSSHDRVKRRAEGAWLAVVHQLALGLMLDGSVQSGVVTPETEALFQVFLNRFVLMLNNEHAAVLQSLGPLRAFEQQHFRYFPDVDVRLAIRSCGLMSIGMVNILPQDKMLQLITRLVQRAYNQFSLQAADNSTGPASDADDGALDETALGGGDDQPTAAAPTRARSVEEASDDLIALARLVHVMSVDAIGDDITQPMESLVTRMLYVILSWRPGSGRMPRPTVWYFDTIDVS